MKNTFMLSASAVAACIALGNAQAQGTGTPATTATTPGTASTLDRTVITGRRTNRVSKGATGLAMDVKDTPQTISTIDREDITDYGLSGSNDALTLGTGINVEQYETNRAVFNARGFEVQLTQIDGLGMSNDWGTVVGQQDTFLFERIELIRGANGLLTGVGNSSGTINYVRKRPTNKDGGLVFATAGSYSKKRVGFDYNKVLTPDGAWAGRIVVAHEDKKSHLRALHDKRSTVYGVVDGQIGDSGVLTAGITLQDNKQRSPMWGSLTLGYVNGTQAEFPSSSSTSQDWTYWNTNAQSAFIEYTHTLNADWEAKLTYMHREGEEATRLLYAYSPSGLLNLDNTGLGGWPYRGYSTTRNDVIDANISGQFSAWGRRHSLLAGVSHSKQRLHTDLSAGLTNMFLPLPAFPYGGNVYPEPAWGPRTPDSGGEQQLTRLYVASRLGVTDKMKLVLGLNAVRLEREGSSAYGSNATANSHPKTEKLSPYAGLTYDITPDVLAYVSYSDIFQNQDQTDFTGAYLAPMKGVNSEVGVKAEWLNKRMLSTLALFTAKQEGLATQGAGLNASGNFWYEPKDVKSRGIEFETTGRITPDTKLTFGATRLKLTGPDGRDIYEWVPRNTANFRIDTKLIPKLKLGANARWQSEVAKTGGARQKAYVVTNAFAAYELTDAATIRLNINNLFDKKYVGGITYGAIYGAPRNVAVTLDYKL